MISTRILCVCLGVSNRRVCKACRFARCVASGMLEASGRLTTRTGRTSRIAEVRLLAATSTTSGIDIPSTSSVDVSSDDPLAQFVAFRHLMNVDRRGETPRSWLRASPNGFHDMANECAEAARFTRLARSSCHLFDLFDDSTIVRLQNIICQFFELIRL